jgi:hypothetical protein
MSRFTSKIVVITGGTTVSQPQDSSLRRAPRSS